MANCKNCGNPLDTDMTFCSSCGGRIIKNRLTVGNLARDVGDKYFNWDNTFLKTFAHMLIKPEKVVSSYITGTRKRYMNPISYLAIALTLSGILVFLVKKIMTGPINISSFGQDLDPELARKIMDVVFDYSSLVFVIYIPVFALAGLLTFNKKQYNLSEYTVLFIYVLAHWSILLFPLSVGILLLAPESYWNMSLPTLILMLFFSLFTMQRLNRFSFFQSTLRAGIFSILVFLGYLGIIMVVYVLLFITGVISLEDFKPATQATSSCINWASYKLV